MVQITQADIFNNPQWTPLGAYSTTYPLGQTGYGQQGPTPGGYQPMPYGGGAAGYQPPPFNPGATVGGGGVSLPQSFQDSSGGALTTGLGALSALSAADNLFLGGAGGEAALDFVQNLPPIRAIRDFVGLPETTPATVPGSQPVSQAPVSQAPVSQVPVSQPISQVPVSPQPVLPAAPPTIPADLATGAEALFGTGPEAAEAARQATLGADALFGSGPEAAQAAQAARSISNATNILASGAPGAVGAATEALSPAAFSAAMDAGLIGPGGSFLGAGAGAGAAGAAQGASLIGAGSGPMSFGAVPANIVVGGGGPLAGLTALGPYAAAGMATIAALKRLGRSSNKHAVEAMDDATGAAFQAITNPNFGRSQAQRFASLTGLPFDDYGEYGDPRTLETGANVGGLFNRIEAAGGREALGPSARKMYDDLRNYQVVLAERKNYAALERMGMPADAVRPAPVSTYSTTDSSPITRQIQPYDTRFLQQVMPSGSEGQTYGDTQAGRLLRQGLSPAQVEERLRNVGGP